MNTDNLIADASPISELLNLAWSYHEITPDNFTEVLDWFETHRMALVE